MVSIIMSVVVLLRAVDHPPKSSRATSGVTLVFPPPPSSIMVLDAGRVIELDTPNALLSNKNSSFYSMAKDAGLVADH